MGRATSGRTGLVGLHFLQPRAVMALVEVVRTVDDIGADIKRVFAFAPPRSAKTRRARRTPASS